jgi:hypothetical protein
MSHEKGSLAQVCDGHISPGEEKYQSESDRKLFDHMHPINLDLFPDKEDSKPVIRMVFALAAADAGVDFPRARERDHDHFDEFTAFDVWCAGLGDKAVKHMIDCDLASYQLLLDRSLRPHDAFELQDEGRGSLRRRMAPLTTDNDAHHAIHLRGSESGHKRQATNDVEEQGTRKRSKHTAVEETDGEEETDNELDSGDLDMEAESAA